MATELDVWLHADLTGRLRQGDAGLEFRYRPAWLAREHAVPLSCSLPLRAEPFDHHAARPYFAGLLPEGQLRSLLGRQLEVQDHDDFRLLDALAGDCVGAITLLPVDRAPAAPGTGTERWLDDRQLGKVLQELPQRPMLAGRGGLRTSLPGAHDKLPVVVDGERFALPADGQPSTHILKLPVAGLEHSVDNEAFCLALAREMGLPAVAAEIRSVGGHRCLLVPRYDRQADVHGRITCLQQEDFCQALGVAPELKYENAGGPGLAACFRLLRQVARPNAPQVVRLLDYVIFNVLVGNHDAHARNFSLLHTGTSPTLAPLYDVMATEVYFTLPPKMVMKLGGQATFSAVQARHWDRFADSAGLSRSQTRRRVRALALAMPGAATSVQRQAGFADHPLVAEIVTQVVQRCEITERRLSARRLL